MSDHKSIRLASTLLFVGVVLSFVAGIFHPGRANANVHSAAFAEYAESANWTAIHLGQFAGMAVLIAGLLILFFALDLSSGTPRWVGRLGAVSAITSLALYGVLQAVDGVALKQAVNAWASAPEAEKVARFASAEAIRWLEWGARSYQSFMLGLTFVLFAFVIVRTAGIPSLIGYLMGLSGLAYMAQGWVIGSEGFSANNSLPTLLGIILILAWSLWLLVVGWRMKGPVQASTG